MHDEDKKLTTPTHETENRFYFSELLLNIKEIKLVTFMGDIAHGK